MKSKFSQAILALGIGTIIAFTFGCAAPNIKVSIKTPGQFKLGGISKLAIVKFNSLQDDASVGTYSADEETLRMMQSLVSSAFSAGKTYKVTTLDKENAIADAADAGRTALLATMNERFDGIIYGRVWWQLSPEEQGTYPVKFPALKEWVNKKYTTEVVPGSKVEHVKEVTTRTKDELATVPYRSRKASLMLSLTVYRIDADGTVSKVVETYSVAEQFASRSNGAMSNAGALVGSYGVSRADEMQNAGKKSGGYFSGLIGKKEKKAEVEAKFEPTQNTRTMPSTLQMKVEMANRMVAELSKKLQPTSVTFEISNEFSDKKLAFLLQDNAFLAGREYSTFALEQNLRDAYKADKAKAILDEKACILDEVDIPAAYAKASKLFKEAAGKNLDYIYCEGLCEEGMGHYKQALYVYRLAFEISPKFETAMGISRCLFAMDMAERVKETNKEVKKAEKKANLN